MSDKFRSGFLAVLFLFFVLGCSTPELTEERRPDSPAVEEEDVDLVDVEEDAVADVDVEEDGSGPDLSWWNYEAGKSYFSESGYVEFIPGDVPVILTAPHGGYLEPDYIANRTGTTVRDRNTQELTREYGEAFYELTGKRAHLVILLLARTKLDANRDIDVAAQGSSTAEAVWHEYHGFVEEAQRFSEEMYGPAFYMDIHGHGHPVQRVELGYLLSAAELRRDDEDLNQAEYFEKSSIRALYEANQDRLSFTELLRGPQSFGALLEARGYPSVPSYDQPAPNYTWAYFSGGYNTRRYGSSQGGTMSGIQIEANQSVRFEESKRLEFARGLAEVTLEYLALYYGLDLRREQ